MFTRAIIALPMAAIWVVLTNIVTLESFALGWAVSYGLLYLVPIQPVELNIKRLPAQVFWGMVYLLRLCWDIFYSSIDMARRVLDPRLPINPAIITISTGDDSNSPIVSALSAHAITITPGELVTGFDVDENGQTIMYVHAIDQQASGKQMATDQAQRLQLIQRIMGRD